MDKSLKKLYSILKTMYNKVTGIVRNDMASILKNIESQKSIGAAVFAGQFATWLTLPEEQQLKHFVIYDDFSLLSALLESKGLTDKDIYNIINYVLQRNITSHLLDEEVQIKPADFSLETFNETIFNMDHIKEYGQDETYFESYIRLTHQRLACETYEPNTKEGLFDKELSNYETLKSNHRVMLNYFDTEEFEDKHYIGIVSSLLHLGFSNDIVTRYCKYLKVVETKKVEEKEAAIKKAEAEKRRAETPVVEMPKPKPINQRLIKKTFKELEEYFDFFNMEPKRPLTYDEMIFCLAKLKQTDVTEELMISFINKVDNYNKHNSPITYAEVILKRLKAYKDSFEQTENSDYKDVTNEIISLEEILTEYYSTESDQEKKIWQEYVEAETQMALTLLPKTNTL